MWSQWSQSTPHLQKNVEFLFHEVSGGLLRFLLSGFPFPFCFFLYFVCFVFFYKLINHAHVEHRKHTGALDHVNYTEALAIVLDPSRESCVKHAATERSFAYAESGGQQAVKSISRL